jgi:hypothetical protein
MALSVPDYSIPYQVARHIRYGDCRMCVLGDSIVTDSSSNSNLPYGMQRSWAPSAWTARVGRADYGPPAWAWDSLGTDTFYIGTPTARNPGDTYTNSQTGISPNIGLDLTFSGNVPDFAPEILFRQLNDPSDYAVGDWTSGVSVMSRLVYYRAASGMGTPRIQSVRGTGVVSTSANINMVGTAGVTYADIDCGTGAGAPGIKFTGASSGDETGTEVYTLAYQWYKHSGGVRTPGFGLMQIGEGGWDTADHLNTTQCTDANLAGFLAATLVPNTFLLYIGSNRTATEGTQLAAGTTTEFEANVRAIIARYNAAAILAGATAPIRWLLVNPHDTGAGATIHAAMGRALYNVKLDSDYYGFINAYTLSDPELADGAHPTADGAVTLGTDLWAPIASSSTFSVYSQLEQSYALAARRIRRRP